MPLKLLLQLPLYQSDLRTVPLALQRSSRRSWSLPRHHPQHRAERRARRLQLPLLLSLLLPRRPFRRQHHHQRKFSPLFISITPIQLQKSKLISPISISAPRTVHNNNHNQLLVLVLVDACRHSCWQRRAAAWQLLRSCNYRKQIPNSIKNLQSSIIFV